MEREILNNAWLGIKMTGKLAQEEKKLILPYFEGLTAQTKAERNKYLTELFVRIKKSQLKRRQMRVNRVSYTHG